MADRLVRLLFIVVPRSGLLRCGCRKSHNKTSNPPEWREQGQAQHKQTEQYTMQKQMSGEHPVPDSPESANQNRDKQSMKSINRKCLYANQCKWCFFFFFYTKKKTVSLYLIR